MTATPALAQVVTRAAFQGASFEASILHSQVVLRDGKGVRVESYVSFVFGPGDVLRGNQSNRWRDAAVIVSGEPI